MTGAPTVQGKPCKRCGGCVRYASRKGRAGRGIMGNCVACDAARSVKRRATHPERTAAENAAWAKAHPAEMQAKARNYRAANLDKVRALANTRYARNPAPQRARVRLRKHAERRATSPGADKALLRAYALEAVTLSLLAGEAWHGDHYIPLHGVDSDGVHIVCGLNNHHNIRVIRGAENLAKGNRFDPASALAPLPSPILTRATPPPVGAIAAGSFRLAQCLF